MSAYVALFRALASVAVLLLVVALTWMESERWHEPSRIASTPHPEKVLANNAVEAGRTNAPLQPLQPLPTTAAPTATFHITAAPTAPVLRPGVIEKPAPAPMVASGQGIAAAPAPEAASGPTPAQVAACLRWLQCPATDIDGTLVHNKDGTADLYASAQGRPLHATYNVGTKGEAAPAEHPWAIGLVWGTGNLRGGFMDRDLGPLRLGAEVGSDQHGAMADAKVGWRF
jgi:hypothetical protein